MIALLDINVLLALFDPGHVHHEAAHQWFADNRAAGWATCPLTENGFVRIASSDRYPGRRMTIAEAIHSLGTFRDSGHYTFWPDAASLLNEQRYDPRHIHGPQQLTDVYLLGLAVANSGRLATFDGRIPLRAVAGATRESLALVRPRDEQSR